jgi:hypothetical protein
MTYLGSGDPARRLSLFDGSEAERTDYQPVWVNHLADDVTIEGSAMNGVVQAEHIVANYRPRTTLLLVSRLVGEHFAGTPCGEHFASSAPSEG